MNYLKISCMCNFVSANTEIFKFNYLYQFLCIDNKIEKYSEIHSKKIHKTFCFHWVSFCCKVFHTGRSLIFELQLQVFCKRFDLIFVLIISIMQTVVIKNHFECNGIFFKLFLHFEWCKIISNAHRYS